MIATLPAWLLAALLLSAFLAGVAFGRCTGKSIFWRTL